MVPYVRSEQREVPLGRIKRAALASKMELERVIGHHVEAHHEDAFHSSPAQSPMSRSPGADDRC